MAATATMSTLATSTLAIATTTIYNSGNRPGTNAGNNNNRPERSQSANRPPRDRRRLIAAMGRSPQPGPRQALSADTAPVARRGQRALADNRATAAVEPKADNSGLHLRLAVVGAANANRNGRLTSRASKLPMYGWRLRIMSDRNSRGASMRWQSKFMSAAPLLALLVLFAGIACAQEAGQKTFANAKEAGQALYNAAKSEDKAAVEAVLGASSARIISSGDEVADQNNRDTFIERYEQMNRWAKEINGEQTLILGAENWPFPIPLKKDAAGTWFFDAKAGVKEILFRRIGKNELAAIRVCRALADAQGEYFSQTHDGDAVKQYAQKFISDPGKQNGLYWKVAEGETESPIGPLVAYATGQGYGGEHNAPQPFHGYFYRMLTDQGERARGDKELHR